MIVYRIDADAAFDLLKWRSQEANIKLRVLAEQLLADFRALDYDDTLPSRAVFDQLLLTAHNRVRRWRPNAGLFSACGLRCPTGDLTTIRRLLDDGRTAMTDIATQTGVPLEYLHYLIGEFDPPLPRQSINTPLRCAPLWDARYFEGQVDRAVRGPAARAGAHRRDARRVTPHRDAPGPPLWCGAAPARPPPPL